MDTRISSDRARQLDAIRRSEEQYNYGINVPGNGEAPAVPTNPNIRLQHWAGALRSNSSNIECELRGQNERCGKEVLGAGGAMAASEVVQSGPYTDSMGDYHTTVTNPSWNLRGAHEYYYTQSPLVNGYDPRVVALSKIHVPFETNVNTRNDAYEQYYGRF